MSMNKRRTKRKRAEEDDGPEADGAREKKEAGQIVPAVPKSEGGAGDTKKHRFRQRPTPPMAPGKAYERLQEALYGVPRAMRSREEVLRGIDDIIYFALDVAKGCVALENLMESIDLGWMTLPNQPDIKVYTLNGDPSTFKPMWETNTTASFLASMCQWGIIINTVMGMCSIKESDLFHPELPEKSPKDWLKIIQDLLNKLYIFWAKLDEYKNEAGLQETRWRAVNKDAMPYRKETVTSIVEEVDEPASCFIAATSSH